MQKEEIASKTTIFNTAKDASLSYEGRLCVLIKDAEGIVVDGGLIKLSPGDMLVGPCTQGKVAKIDPGSLGGRWVQVEVPNVPYAQWPKIEIPRLAEIGEDVSSTSKDPSQPSKRKEDLPVVRAVPKDPCGYRLFFDVNDAARGGTSTVPNFLRVEIWSDGMTPTVVIATDGKRFPVGQKLEGNTYCVASSP